MDLRTGESHENRRNFEPPAPPGAPAEKAPKTDSQEDQTDDDPLDPETALAAGSVVVKKWGVHVSENDLIIARRDSDDTDRLVDPRILQTSSGVPIVIKRL